MQIRKTTHLSTSRSLDATGRLELSPLKMYNCFISESRWLRWAPACQTRRGGSQWQPTKNTILTTPPSFVSLRRCQREDFAGYCGWDPFESNKRKWCALQSLTSNRNTSSLAYTSCKVINLFTRVRYMTKKIARNYKVTDSVGFCWAPHVPLPLDLTKQQYTTDVSTL